jgi:hypothetical protein
MSDRLPYNDNWNNGSAGNAPRQGPRQIEGAYGQPRQPSQPRALPASQRPARAEHAEGSMYFTVECGILAYHDAAVFSPQIPKVEIDALKYPLSRYKPRPGLIDQNDIPRYTQGKDIKANNKANNCTNCFQTRTGRHPTWDKCTAKCGFCREQHLGRVSESSSRLIAC